MFHSFSPWCTALLFRTKGTSHAEWVLFDIDSSLRERVHSKTGAGKFIRWKKTDSCVLPWPWLLHMRRANRFDAPAVTLHTLMKYGNYSHMKSTGTQSWRKSMKNTANKYDFFQRSIPSPFRKHIFYVAHLLQVGAAGWPLERHRVVPWVGTLQMKTGLWEEEDAPSPLASSQRSILFLRSWLLPHLRCQTNATNPAAHTEWQKPRLWKRKRNGTLVAGGRRDHERLLMWKGKCLCDRVWSGQWGQRGWTANLPNHHDEDLGGRWREQIWEAPVAGMPSCRCQQNLSGRWEGTFNVHWLSLGYSTAAKNNKTGILKHY